MTVVVRRSAAYALPMVLVMVALLAAALGLFLRTAEDANRSSTRIFRRQQAQVALQGTTRATAVAAGQFLFSQPAEPDNLPTDPTAAATAMAAHYAQLRVDGNTFLGTLQPSLTPTGMTLDTVAIAAVAPRRAGQVQDGAFRGMNGLTQPFDLEVSGHHNQMRDGSFVSMHAAVERVFIPMFQFFAFIDGYAFVFNGPGAKFSGRVHSNGNMCIGSGSNSFFETITSAGKIYRLHGSGCRNEVSGGFTSGSPSPTIFVSTNGFPAPFAAGAFSLLNKDADSATWLTDVNTWKGALSHVADSTHGIPKLKPPITGAPITQKGRNAIHALRLNNDNSRFLIDPLLTADSGDVARQKMAFKADLRIIDGIWYMRDPANPLELGTPIWSDHPGQMNANHVEDKWTGLARNVGQDDIFVGARPQRYSWYRTASNGAALLAAPPTTFRPVVSYGALFRKPVGSCTASKAQPCAVWVPGFYEGTAQTSAACTATSPTAACFPVREATTTAQLLQGTRSGFRSAWDESGLTTGAADCGTGVNRGGTFDLFASAIADNRRTAQVNMLPLNFDIDALQDALADSSSGELGAHFGGGGRPAFNGIVYISATWPGFRDGFGTTATSDRAGMWPFQGLQSDPFSGQTPNDVADGQPRDNLTSLTNAATYDGLNYGTTGGNTDIDAASRQGNRPFQQALPYSFCSDNLPSDFNAARLSSYNQINLFDNSGSTPRRFFAPACSKYHDSTPSARLNARINAVRVINGSNMRPSVLPLGLTIVSNLPVYVLGSLNTTSGAGATTTVLGDLPSQSGATPWSPMLIGGDTISLLSNSWTDDFAPWNVPVRSYYDRRIPVNTQLNGAFLYGWAEAALNPASGTGCREELTYSIRLHEKWSNAAGIQREIRGSIFVGWNSVYGAGFSNVHQANSSGAWHDTDGSTKIYGYDYHFDRVTNQPPGAPQFELTNIKRVVDE